jgi:hypothetical protein
MAVFMQSLFPGSGASTVAATVAGMLAEDAGRVLVINAAGSGALDIHFNLPLERTPSAGWRITKSVDFTDRSLDALLAEKDLLHSRSPYGEILVDLGGRSASLMEKIGCKDHLFLTVADADTHAAAALAGLKTCPNEYVLINKKLPYSAVNRDIVQFMQSLAQEGLGVCPVSIPYDDFIAAAALNRYEASAAYPYSAAVGCIRSLSAWIYAMRRRVSGEFRGVCEDAGFEGATIADSCLRGPADGA